VSALACEHCVERLPDLALGIAAGDERDDLLAHVADCARCADELERLTHTAEALLLTTAPQEPPDGFESAVLQAFAPAAVARRRRPRWLVGAAAAAIVLVVFAAGVTVGRRADPGPAQSAAPGPPPGSAVPVAVLGGTLVAPDGRPVGQAVAHDNPSWLAVALDPAAPRGTYTVVCDYEAGDSFTAGSVTVAAPGAAAWSATVPIPLDELRRVRLVNTGGGPNLEAPIQSS
jgi:hypothetical protein